MGSSRGYYHACQFFGSNIDPGESCECGYKAYERNKRLLLFFVCDEDGQMRMDLMKGNTV